MMSEEDKLRKAIWDMMNFANMYVLVLDEKMNVKFANYSLSNVLGFESEHDLLGKCWLDFIKVEDKSSIANIHGSISLNKDDANDFCEYNNDIITLDQKVIPVKWFNAHINTDFNWAFSIGIQNHKPVMITADSVREYYKNVIANDRTMILSLRNSILSGSKTPDDCESDLTL